MSLSPYFCGAYAGLSVGLLLAALRVGFHKAHPRLTITLAIFIVLDVVMDGLLGRFFT